MKKIALIAGAGRLPGLLIEALPPEALQVFTIKGQGLPQSEAFNAEQSICVAPGALAALRKKMQQLGVQQVVMAGAITKPSLFDLRPDLDGLRLLKSVATQHDDDLLRALCSYWQQHGFEVVAPHALLPALLMPEGALSSTQPSPDFMADVALGIQAQLALGQLDIGQACIVKNKTVLGVEAVEGTDALITRCAPLRGKSGQGGILVKGAKPQQTLDADMPTVGLTTLHKLAEYAYAGLALEAGKCLLIDQDACLAFANKHKLVVFGFKRESFA